MSATLLLATWPTALSSAPATGQTTSLHPGVQPPQHPYTIILLNYQSHSTVTRFYLFLTVSLSLSHSLGSVHTLYARNLLLLNVYVNACAAINLTEYKFKKKRKEIVAALFIMIVSLLLLRFFFALS